MHLLKKEPRNFKESSDCPMMNDQYFKNLRTDITTVRKPYLRGDGIDRTKTKPCHNALNIYLVHFFSLNCEGGIHCKK